MNSNITFVGNLTRDPELYQSEGRKPRATFSVAVNEGWGEKETTHFINVTAFGDLAENIVDSLGRGNRVIVEGRFDSYKKPVEIDGVEKEITIVSVVANSVGPDLRWARAKVTRVTRERDDAPAEDADEQVDEVEETEEAPKAKSKAKAKPKAKAKAKPVEDDDVEDF